MYLLEYIWIDAHDQLRSKTKIPDTLEQFNNPPIWTYDGSSTEQATGTNSDIILKPVATFKDPFQQHLNYPSTLVLCETYTSEGQPHITNYRAQCAITSQKAADQQPLFGIEQEYLLMETDGSKPYCWNTLEQPGCGPQGPYYCSVGADRAFGRKVVQEHMEMCLYAGIKIGGVNAEVMPSQWEYQIGPLPPLEVSDHLWVSRYILNRVCEKNKCVVTFHPKPFIGWNGSGGHTNFSTEKMRLMGSTDAKQGMTEIIAACEKLAQKHDEHIAVYGEHNDQRLTGHHETASIKSFSYGVANRGSSVRIPLLVAKEGYGYLEDRRPAANLNPYRVTNIMMQTILEV